MITFALAKALGARLSSDPGVTALVAPDNIVTRQGPPHAFPALHLGEDVEVASDLTFDRRHIDVFMTLHIWTKEAGSSTARSIAAAIRNAVQRDLTLDTGRLVDITFESARYIRDPDDLDTAHGVVVIEATVEET